MFRSEHSFGVLYRQRSPKLSEIPLLTGNNLRRMFVFKGFRGFFGSASAREQSAARGREATNAVRIAPAAWGGGGSPDSNESEISSITRLRFLQNRRPMRPAAEPLWRGGRKAEHERLLLLPSGTKNDTWQAAAPKTRRKTKKSPKPSQSIDSKDFPSKSGYQDSNLGPPAPKAGALTGLRYTPKYGLT